MAIWFISETAGKLHSGNRMVDTQARFQEIAPDLELTSNGWWRSRKLSAVSYPDEGNELCFLVEDSSFWFEHRNHCILEAMRQFPPRGTFFDVGGGNGCVARAIQESGREVVLMEPGLAGVQNALSRGIQRVVRGTLDDAGIVADSLPAVGLFDVVEHIEDDVGFMARVHRLLVPEGRVYITVPAFQWLWSSEDELAGHSRRYTLSTLRRLVEQAGFEVELGTYFFGFLPLPILVRRVIPYRLGLKATIGESAVRSDHLAGNSFVRRMLRALMRRELSRIARRWPVRMGGSCLLVARKRPALPR
ncbi:MAG TPA: class I SAM-dependent methyltransferase [Bryobacteraceae bacterium]|nr:class I SAM-dependent methyltransferase [Bryobacteraceae bacterium]